eukprot:CAMPEP_0203746198 /NCGR_PEP_ID=MMETSP0098-20131031/1712_1 /ASSEMBLY_ACC=CAM_ASM_000208 /TAXON_ID=96639 /ORGANISM=" , Strain NY0313808BC1" /LENGTH=208 /DNA_ID=CAMNT_0050634203 /DNA_START=441 /DNA_END=1064 /DNA_ORIENTATION=-
MSSKCVQVVCVRHGETYWNREKRLQGQTDTELSDVGLEQAVYTGEHISNRFESGFHTVTSSDLERALKTCQAIVTRVKGGEKSIETDVRLREIHLGVFQGKTAHECMNDGSVAHHWNAFRKDETFRIPEGESMEDLDQRAKAALEDIAVKTAKKVDEETPGRALLVAHGGVIKSLGRAVNFQNCTGHLGNCSISVLQATVSGDSVLDW